MYGTQLAYFIKQSGWGEDEQNAIMHNLKSLFKLGSEFSKPLWNLNELSNPAGSRKEVESNGRL